MNTQTQDQIIDQVGADNWGAVEDEFAGMTTEEVNARLDEIFPTEDNTKLAQMITDELN